MKTLAFLLANFQSRPLTHPITDRVPVPIGRRGEVKIDDQHCIGCGSCAYVCSSAAIDVQNIDLPAQWIYDMGQCTFCGCCIDVCPVQALHMETAHMASYMERATVKVSVSLPCSSCPQCGKPAQSTAPAVLERVFPELSAEILVWSQLCPECRQTRFEVTHTTKR